ncbi:hypothetical protein ACFXAZ_38065 [Streptomyces sp. NPDC059477]|uniref:hypothetical protein n=1 Tax=Streptomyces sp. NPDC059477 TaxID=3346847 RepID=UPI00367E27D7
MTSEQAAAAVIDATMIEDGGATSTQLAAAERVAGLLFQPESVEAAVSAAREQAHAEHAAELAQAREQLAAAEAAREQREAVLRLCEGRPGHQVLLVSDVAVAAGYGTTALDGLPMTLRLKDGVSVPGLGAPPRVVVRCTSSYGGRADLLVEGTERAALAALLVPDPVDVDGPCPTDGCGAPDGYGASGPARIGWARLEVAGIGDGPRWYCSPGCVSAAMARAGDELAADDQAAAVDPHQQAPGAGVEGWPPRGGHDALCSYASGIGRDCTCREDATAADERADAGQGGAW